MLENLILDWDGVFTIIEKEAQPYLAHYPLAFASKTKLDEIEVVKRAEVLRERIAANPDSDMVVNGHIVARANVTPYDINRTAFLTLLNQLRAEGHSNLPLDCMESDFLHQLHKESHQKVVNVYRQGAKECLQGLLDCGYSIVVVTSSGTEKVEENLMELGFSQIPVLGRAKKYNVEPQITAVPESIQIPGFRRPTLIRRGSYLRILQQLDEHRGFNSKNTAVVGEVFEHDLALPLQMGYRSIFLVTPAASDLEITFLSEVPKGKVVQDLRELSDYLNRLRITNQSFYQEPNSLRINPR